MKLRFANYAAMAATAFLATAFVTAPANAQKARERADCSVSLQSLNVAVIGGGGGGHGTLKCGAKSYAFTLGGAGLGSVGISKMRASGYVYGLKTVNDFEGVYGQARAGATVGNVGNDAMVLQNEHGVVMRLKARSKGFALTAGGDALVIKFK